MAAVAHTKLTKLLPVGDREMQSYRTSALGAGAADEYIVTGLSKIDAIVGFAVIGPTTSTVAPSFKKNAQGTADAAVAENGSLGIESTDAGIDIIEVTVIGIP